MTDEPSPAQSDAPMDLAPASTPMDFIQTRDDVEASIMVIGANSVQVVLVAASGEWLRYVVPDQQMAEEMCARLGVPHHEGYPEHLRMRMAKYQRTNEDWKAAPYPERYRGTST